MQQATLKELVCDEQYQMRVEIPDSEDYAEQLRATEAWPFPPLTCFQKGKKFVVLDGFTRARAATAVRWTRPIPIQLVPEEQAWLVALAANSDNGYRRTNADKQKAVCKAIVLYPDERPAEIARRCRVSHTYVHKMVQSIKTGEEPQVQTKGPCPNCGEDVWVEHEEGFVCSHCSHAHGEPAAADEGTHRTPANASKRKNAQTPAPAPKPAPSPKAASKPDPKRTKAIANLRTALGVTIREWKAAGLIDSTVEAAFEILKTTINKAK